MKIKPHLCFRFIESAFQYVIMATLEKEKIKQSTAIPKGQSTVTVNILSTSKPPPQVHPPVGQGGGEHQALLSSRASKSGEQTILCLTFPNTVKSPVLPSVPIETSSWEQNRKKTKACQKCYQCWFYDNTSRETHQYQYHTWRKEHDAPRDTSSVTCPSMSCTRPDFLTSIFPTRPSRRSFRLQLLSSASSSCSNQIKTQFTHITSTSSRV